MLCGVLMPYRRIDFTLPKKAKRENTPFLKKKTGLSIFKNLGQAMDSWFDGENESKNNDS
jgi:hypothetical protein